MPPGLYTGQKFLVKLPLPKGLLPLSAAPPQAPMATQATPATQAPVTTQATQATQATPLVTRAAAATAAPVKAAQLQPDVEVPLSVGYELADPDH